MRPGVILYGPPGVGKDTISAALQTLDKGYILVQRLKCGIGRRKSYRMVTAAQLEALQSVGDIIWMNHRYGATYAVSKNSLESLPSGCIPIIHLGQSDGIDAVRAATGSEMRWTIVDLFCAHGISERRLIERGSTDVAERLDVWAITSRLDHADMALDTGRYNPTQAARQIHNLVLSSFPG